MPLSGPLCGCRLREHALYPRWTDPCKRWYPNWPQRNAFIADTCLLIFDGCSITYHPITDGFAMLPYAPFLFCLFAIVFGYHLHASRTLLSHLFFHCFPSHISLCTFWSLLWRFLLQLSVSVFGMHCDQSHINQEMTTRMSVWTDLYLKPTWKASADLSI
jgi:hypothetical protein